MEPISVNNLLEYIVWNEVLMFSCVEGGSAPVEVSVDVVTTVQAEPVAGPA